MIKKIKRAVGDCVTLILGILFALAAAPVIHLTGLDNVDSSPMPEDIEKSQRLAESLKKERSK